MFLPSLKVTQIKREGDNVRGEGRREGNERGRKIFSLVLSPKDCEGAKARAGPAVSQERGSSSRFSTWVAEAQVFRRSSAAFPGV